MSSQLIVPEQMLQAAVHRQCFASVVKAYPWIRRTSVLDVLIKHGAANDVARSLHMTDAVALSSVLPP